MPRPRLYLVRRNKGDGHMPIWKQAINDYCGWERAAGHSPGTVDLRRRYLLRLAASIERGPWDATADDLLSFLDQDWKPETRKSARSAVCRFYRWAMETERIKVDPAYRLPTVRVPAGKPHPVPDDVIAMALARSGEREKMMVMLASFMGLRRAEVAAVHSRDIEGMLLRVCGKGGKTRMVPIPPPLRPMLANTDGFAFPGNYHGHLSPNRVGIILRKMLGAYSAHTMRHRFASTVYEQTHDIRAVQELLGHASVATTQIYTAVQSRALYDAVNGASKLSA